MATRHRPVSPRSRSRRSLLSRLAAPLAIAALLFVGLAVYTVVNGELRLPFGGGVLFAFPKEQVQATGAMPLPEGTVAVYACPRALPAFTRITREHLLTADGLYTVPVVEQAIEPNRLFRADVDGLKRLLGRVLRRDKSVNFAFSEADLLPLGTRPGPSAGIPPGKRGIWIDASQVHGLADARAGDLVDLVAAKATAAPPRIDTAPLGNLSDPVVKARIDAFAGRSSAEPRASSWVVAHGALVIAPMRIREIGAGSATRTRPATVEEVFVALAPQEVAAFGQALAEDVTMLAAPRSGQPDTSETQIQDARPVDPNVELRRMLLGGDDVDPSLGMVEVIRGDQRQTVTVPRSHAAQDGR